jgi:SOS response regulatory protein OraA/RecX
LPPSKAESKAEPGAEDVALRALRAADRSRSELDARLEQRGFAAEERRRALDDLERLGYLDDDRTAETRAQRLAERGYGDAYIRADLERRGLPTERPLARLEPESERASRFEDRSPSWLARRGFAHED